MNDKTDPLSTVAVDPLVMRFGGCKYLDFEPTDYTKYTAQKVRHGDHVAWKRAPQFGGGKCQFCAKGNYRLPNPDSCTDKYLARCSYYSEVEHVVTVAA